MMRQVTSINWAYIGDAVPAFVTLAFMPLSYSVAYGLIAGMMAYTSLNVLIWLTKKLSRGRWVPPDADMAEYWTCKFISLISSTLIDKCAQINLDRDMSRGSFARHVMVAGSGSTRNLYP